MPYTTTHQQLNEIRQLRDGWNGNGASKFSEEILDTLQQILEKLPYEPSIFPTARGSIQLEFENSNADYLEFELFEDGKLKMFFCEHNEKTVTKDIVSSSIRNYVNTFMINSKDLLNSI